MKNRNWKILTVILLIAVIILGAFLGLRGNRPDETFQPVIIVGKVCQDSHYGGTLGCLDTWDFPVTQCQVILRYAGAEGTTQIDNQASSPWSVYVSNGKIIDQVQVDENGVYSFNLDWQPEGVFTGDKNQEVTAVLYEAEIMTTIQGFCGQTVIGLSQIRVTKDTEAVSGPIFLLFR